MTRANLVVVLILAGAAGICGYAAAFGITASQTLAWVAFGVAALGVAALLRNRPPLGPTVAAEPRWLKATCAVAALVALWQVARLAVFMVAPAQSAWSTVPGSEWEVRHSCFTAYYVAAGNLGARSVYDTSLYTEPGDDPAKPRRPLRLGPFNVDVFEYPPPFLLLPRALLLLARDFDGMRALWFGLSIAALLVAMMTVARALPPPEGNRAVLLIPLIWAGIATLNTLQKGNVQQVVIAAALLAMLLFERQSFAAGGLLLAFATVSKLYPGMLVLYLLASRRWRAAAWTAGFGVVLLAASLADTGIGPYREFLSHLSGLLGGEAFPAFRNPAATAINGSVPGLVFKLKLFGVPGMGFVASKALGWVYTVVLVAVVLTAARRRVQAEDQPLVWLALLTLATLRSPFLPQGYSVFPVLWLLTLVAAKQQPRPRTMAIVLLVWAGLNVYYPIDWRIVGPRLLAVVNLVPQILTAAVAVFALRHAFRRGRLAAAFR